MTIIKTQPGKEYQQHVINEDVRKLMETGLFGNVRPSWKLTNDNKVVVYFAFVEYPSRIEEIEYRNLKHFKPEDLNAATGLRKGAPMNPVTNQAACQAIVRFYQEKNYPLAGCTLLQGDKPGDTKVVFNITESHTMKIRDISFEGPHFVSSARLRTQIMSSTPWIPWVDLIGGVYDPQKVEDDARKLEEYFRSFGYWDAHVEREVQYDSEMRSVVIIFHIHEGLRYKIENVGVDGVKALPREEIDSIPRVHKGEDYDKSKLDKDIKNIHDFYGYNGWNADILPQLSYMGPGLVKVQYLVQERGPFRVGEIKIVGNDVTRQDIILNQLYPLQPGQILTYPDLRAAEDRLKRLGIFETNLESGIHPTVTVIDQDGPGVFKDLLVQIQEAKTGSLMFGVGVTSDAGLVGNVVLSERNFDILNPPQSWDDLVSGRAFRGGDQEFRMEAAPGTEVQRYMVSWRDPSFLNSPYSLSLSGYYYTRIYDEDYEKRLGTRIGVDRNLASLGLDHWFANAGFRIEDVSISHAAHGSRRTIRRLLATTR